MKSLLLITAITFSNLLLSQIPTAGLIGRWEFSGNANDLSPSGNHGTVYGATLVSDRCGNANSAYSFNGTTDYIIMQAAGPTGSNSRSVTFWAKTSYTNTAALFTYGSNNPGEAFQIQYNYGCSGVGLDINIEQITRGNACINDNNWHHIALVFDGSGNQQMNSADVYVDAQLISSQVTCSVGTGTQILNTGSQTPVVIGNDSNFPNPIRWFQGSLDDYYLYDRALTPTEIHQLFTACSLPLTGNSNMCKGSVNTYSVPAMQGTSFIWSLPTGWIGTSSTNVIAATAGTNPGSGVVSVSILTGCGGTLTLSSKTVSVSNCTAIKQLEAEFRLLLYPNPASDFVSIDSGSEAISVISISSMTGQIVIDEKFSGKTQVNISNLKSGVYFVTVKMDNGHKKTVKLLKE